MVHCPECTTTIETADDVEFLDLGAEIGIVRASKRFYTATCAECGRTLGNGVAGARANAGGAGVAGGGGA